MMSYKRMVLLVLLFHCGCGAQTVPVEKWGVYELSLPGPTEGNPFAGIQLSAVFQNGDQVFEPEGFYDGNGVFKIRFMPNAEGTWKYKTKSNRAALNGKEGEFVCGGPTPGNHGPVGVRNQYHFGYADGTVFFPFGTTLYEWTFQPDEVRQQTINTLKNAPFNKVRFLILPMWKDYYVQGERALDCFPFAGDSKEGWDFSRFNPEFFRRLEGCVTQLRETGIEAELILFHPYDDGKWGFDTMDMATNERYVHYVAARFAAYRNVWWSLANENSYMEKLTDADWDHLFQVVQGCDPYGHLRSIHNADRIYDHTRPWVTHVSLQYYISVRYFGFSPLLRDIYKKPVIFDEINYEGNHERRWGQLTGEEMVYRFWIAVIGGAYATHGETIQRPGNIDWISSGGELLGQSPERIGFLRKIVQEGPRQGLDPVDHYFEPNMAGQPGQYYLIYFGKDPIKEWAFRLPGKELKPDMRFKVDVIDAWAMTITPQEQIYEIEKLDRYWFVDKKRSIIALPGNAYMALRIQRIE